MHLTVRQCCPEGDVADTSDQQIPQELQFIDFRGRQVRSDLMPPLLLVIFGVCVCVFVCVCVCVCEFLKILELTICFISSINFPAKFAAPGLRGRSQFLPPTAPFYATGQYTN